MTHPSDDDQQPADRPEAADPAPPAEPPRSIWEPLDGSEPRPVVPAAPPAAFERPPAAPLAFPGVAPPPTQGPPPRAMPDGRAVYVLAGWGPRFGAFLIDSILIGLIVLCVTLPLALAFGLTVDETLTFFGRGTLPDSAADPTALYVTYALQLLLPSFTQAAFLVRWNGQTPGKRALNLRVVRADGEPMTTAVAARREVFGKTIVVAILTVFTLGIGVLLNYLWPLWDAQNRAGHDAIAGTRVIVVPREA